MLFSYHGIDRATVRLESVTITTAKNAGRIKESIFESEGERCGVQEYKLCIVGRDGYCSREFDKPIIEAPVPDEIRTRVPSGSELGRDKCG